MKTRVLIAVAYALRWGILVLPGFMPAQSVPELKLTRDLRIDAADNELTPISFMGVAPNGTIAFQQNQDGTVRFFDARGASLGTFGRKGQGPGEFTNAGRMGWLGDTLIVSDIGTRRFTLISADRKLVKTVPWVQSVTAPGAPSGVAPQRVGQARFPYADGSQLGYSGFSDETPVPAWLGGGKPATVYLRLDANGGLQEVLGRLPTTAACSVALNTGGGFELSRIPFCPLPMDDVAPDGSRLLFAYVEQGAQDYHVVAIRSDGDTTFARSIAYRPQPIPRSVRDSVASAAARSPMPSRRATADRIPEAYPPLSRLLAGRDGTTWLELFTPSGDRTWLVLDAQGTLAGRLTVPRNIDLKVASRDVIWATETDDDGLQHIVRYRVNR
jgi:hypothetical protein